MTYILLSYRRMAWMIARLVELRGNKWRCVFAAKNLSDPSPCRTSFLKLRANGLCVIVVLHHHPPEVFVDLYPLKDISTYQELLAEGQS
jgi:hypothetical protein